MELLKDDQLRYDGDMSQVLTLDADGRLPLPKEVRRRFHLRGGSSLRLAEESGRIVLEPIEQPSARTRAVAIVPLIDGPLQGPAPGHRQLREERLDHLLGSK